MLRVHDRAMRCACTFYVLIGTCSLVMSLLQLCALVSKAECLVRTVLYMMVYSLICFSTGATSATRAHWDCSLGTFGASCSSLMPRSSFSNTIVLRFCDSG